MLELQVSAQTDNRNQFEAMIDMFEKQHKERLTVINRLMIQLLQKRESHIVTETLKMSEQI